MLCKQTVTIAQMIKGHSLITLKEGKGLLPTALDITDNPRHLQIMELEGRSSRAYWMIPKLM